MVDGVLGEVDTTSLLVCQAWKGGGGLHHFFVRLEMLAGCLSLLPLDFPHERSQHFGHGQVCLAAEETRSPDLVPGGVLD